MSKIDDEFLKTIENVVKDICEKNRKKERRTIIFGWDRKGLELFDKLMKEAIK